MQRPRELHLALYVDDFALAEAAGTLNARIGKGRLLEVGPGLGRVFGLINFGALQRRLSAAGSRLSRWAESDLPTAEIVERLYWCALSRAPHDQSSNSVRPIFGRRASTWAWTTAGSFVRYTVFFLGAVALV